MGRPAPPGARVRQGRRAEAHVAAWYVHGLGHVEVDRNLRLGPHEIDLVMARAGVIRLVEVRSTAATPPEDLIWSMVGRKARRLRRAARAFLRAGRAAGAERLVIDGAVVRFRRGEPPVLRIWPDVLPLSKTGW